MKVSIDKDICTGCELCVSTCPYVFEMGDDGLAQVKSEEVAANCPVECIKIS
jgi:ferredoxin